ncbi:hypothetical protein [Thalassotalea euphylliae]|nr:hypothetical protein [Thalassotalea euphylliae]
MAHNEDTVLASIKEETAQAQKSLAQQLADAQQEIEELKLKLMWMERSYE